MSLLRGQLSGTRHRAISGSLGRLRRWRRLAGFVGFPLTGLTFSFSEDGEAEEEEEDETAW